MARLTRAETKERTRQALLEAGSAIFAAKGFHAASVEEIAEAASFSRGAFYANFTDKADLLMTIIEEQRGSALAEMVELVGAADDSEKLTTAQRWYDGITEHPLDAAVTELMTHVVQDDELRRRMARQRDVDRGHIATAVADYCAHIGVELPIPAHHFAAMMLAIGDGLSAQRHLDPDAVPSDLFGAAAIWLWTGVWGGDPPVA